MNFGGLMNETKLVLEVHNSLSSFAKNTKISKNSTVLGDIFIIISNNNMYWAYLVSGLYKKGLSNRTSNMFSRINEKYTNQSRQATGADN